jgi:hypothetical protein
MGFDTEYFGSSTVILPSSGIKKGNQAQATEITLLNVKVRRCVRIT